MFFVVEDFWNVEISSWEQEEKQNFVLNPFFKDIFYRPGVGGAVLQTPPSLIYSFIHLEILFLKIFKTP